MTETPPQDGSNRRTEERRHYTQRCLIRVTGPSEAMLSQPLDGETVNVTEHGVRVSIAGFPTPRFQLWREILERDSYLQVEIRLRLDDTFVLQGQIVWISFDGNLGFPAGTCDAGILLSVLSPDAARHYRQMLKAAADATPGLT
jgi:hypothetical protein